jgi:hypothetical protein
MVGPKLFGRSTDLRLKAVRKEGTMSSALTYEGTPEATGVSFKGIGILVAGLVLGAAIGLVVANTSTTTDAPEVSVTGMALDDFIRLNTTSYNGLAPVATVAVVESLQVHPGFFDMNVGSFDGLAPVAAAAVVPGYLETPIISVAPATAPADPGFLDMNIGSLEYPVTGYSEPLGGIG